MATVSTAATWSNTALNPAAGQAFLGSRVESTPTVFPARTVFAGGIAAAGQFPTITLTPGSGTVSSITAASGYDMAFNFTFIAGTASIFGGTLASVVYGSPLDVTPLAVQVSVQNNSGTIGLPAGVINMSKTGFSIAGNAPVSGGTYTVNCFTVRSPL